VFQAVALHYGLLSIVQPLLVAELVFTLVLRRSLLHQDIAPAAWSSALIVCVALAVFVTVAEPHGGTPAPDRSHWLSCLVTFGGVVAACALLARRGTPVRRAALYATASAIVFAFMATFMKAATQTLTTGGFRHMLGAWPVYGIVICGIAGSILQQAALQAGPLSVSQPLFTSVDPAVAIVLSIWIFGEHYTKSPANIIVGLASFVTLIVGVVLLTRTAPATISAAPDTRAHSPRDDRDTPQP
jgi:hypothetical protein